MYSKIDNKLKEGLGVLQENFGQSTNSREHQLKGFAKRYSSNANYLFKDLIQKFKNNLKSKPFEGIVMAVSIGIVIGYIFRRK